MRAKSAHSSIAVVKPQLIKHLPELDNLAIIYSQTTVSTSVAKCVALAIKVNRWLLEVVRSWLWEELLCSINFSRPNHSSSLAAFLEVFRLQKEVPRSECHSQSDLIICHIY